MAYTTIGAKRGDAAGRFRGISEGFPGSFPRVYPWLLVFATLDICITSIILTLGGSEVNPVADAALSSLGIPGLILVKIASLFVLVACVEMIARQGKRAQRLAATLAVGAVGVTSFPVLFGAAQIGQAVAAADSEPLFWESVVLGVSFQDVVQHHQHEEDRRAMQRIARLRIAAAEAGASGAEAMAGVLGGAVPLADGGR